MRFADNPALASTGVATSDILPMTDVSTGNDAKITMTNLGSYLLTRLSLTFHSVSRTVQTCLNNVLDGKIDLDTSAGSTTTDGALYAAIVALGWDSDVIE